MAVFVLSLNSCYINRHTIGDGPIGRAPAVKYAHAKQVYLFWGLWAVGHPVPATPQDCGYQIKTAFNVVDGIISMLTGGIVSTRNIKILVNKNSPCDPAIRKLEGKIEKARAEEGTQACEVEEALNN
jgi:hypothetical protein